MAYVLLNLGPFQWPPLFSHYVLIYAGLCRDENSFFDVSVENRPYVKADVPSFLKIDVSVQIKGNIPIGYEVLGAMFLKCSVFWDVTPFSPLKVNRCFGGTCSLCLLPLLLWLLALFSLQPWMWKRWTAPKFRVTFTGLHVIISQKIEPLLIIRSCCTLQKMLIGCSNEGGWDWKDIWQAWSMQNLVKKNLKWKNNLGKLGVDGKNIIKLHPKKNRIWGRGLDSFRSRSGLVADSCEHDNKPDVRDIDFLNNWATVSSSKTTLVCGVTW
jgi:hypothetical protein